MNWIVFLVVSWFAIGFEVGFRETLRLAPGDVAPSFVVPLLVYIALSAPPRLALWAGLLLGAMLDLTWIIPRTDLAEATAIGPNALGALIATQLVLSARGMVIRRHLLTLVVLSIASSVVMAIVVVALMTLRWGYGDPIDFDPTSELGSRLLSAGYTGITAVAWAIVLRFIEPLFQFHHERSIRRH